MIDQALLQRRGYREVWQAAPLGELGRYGVAVGIYAGRLLVLSMTIEFRDQGELCAAVYTAAERVNDLLRAASE